MTIRAIGFLAVLKPDEVVEKTDWGLHIVQDKKMEKYAQVVGTIVELGPDFAAAFKPSIPQWGLKVGDKVLYAKHAGKHVVDPETGEEFLIVLDNDIVGKIEKKNSDSTNNVAA